MMYPPDLQSELIETAEAMAVAAGAVTLKYFRRADLANQSKESVRFDPVTIADQEAEAAMRQVLAERRPDDGILGEEHGQIDGSTGLTWILDPIDGTRGFISGTPTWGVLIALSDADGPQMGIVEQPYIGERFFGGFGRAEMTGPQGTARLATRAAQPLAEATLFSTFPEIGAPEERRAFEAVRDQVKLVRYGMDCYAYALLAAGQIDLVIEAGLQSYDIAAPMAVVQAAGGVVTDWSGGPAHHGGRAIAAANDAIHREALTLLRGVMNG